MKKTLKLKALAAAVMAITGMNAALAQSYADNAGYANAAGTARNVSSDGDITIQGNRDQNNGDTGFTGESVFISSNTGPDSSHAAFAKFHTGGGAEIVGRTLAQMRSTGASFTAEGNAATVNANGAINITSGGAGTFINGTGTGDVTIGNQQNFTYLNGVENNIGVNSFATTNNMGTGTAASTNNIGNNLAGTTIDAQAGNASMSLANGSASTSVTGGVSQLTARTGVANVATSSQVLLSNGGGAKVDANGKLSATGAAAAAPTVGVTLNNGYGNTNGMVITESQSVMSGGTAASSASSLSMNDSGARFSNAATGAPVTVTGVADGKNDFDAVNVRQFAGAIAAVAAQANVPALAAGQTRTVGIGLGNFMSKTGLALGMNLRGDNNATYKLSVSTGLNGGAKAVIGAGAAWAF